MRGQTSNNTMIRTLGQNFVLGQNFDRGWGPGEASLRVVFGVRTPKTTRSEISERTVSEAKISEIVREAILADFRRLNPQSISPGPGQIPEWSSPNSRFWFEEPGPSQKLAKFDQARQNRPCPWPSPNSTILAQSRQKWPNSMRLTPCSFWSICPDLDPPRSGQNPQKLYGVSPEIFPTSPEISFFPPKWRKIRHFGGEFSKNRQKTIFDQISPPWPSLVA